MTRTELATLLQTTEANLNARLIGLKVAPTCGRCCGSGRYSFNQVHGSTCYGCAGKGHIVPNPKTWAATVERAQAAVADGRLAAYIETLRNRRRTKNALDKVMREWKQVSNFLDYDWRKAAAAHPETAARCGYEITDEMREHRARSDINSPIAKAYDALGKVAYGKDYAATAAALDAALAVIAEACTKAAQHFGIAY